MEGQRKSKAEKRTEAMGMSDRIEAFINELLKDDEEEWLELKRNELASIFGCVPSQINYVISTRFNPERGYIVESRRGGGGYLRIRQLRDSGGQIAQTIKVTGDSIDEKSARKYLSCLVSQNVIDKRIAAIIMSGITDAVLTAEQPERDRIRANIFKNMLANAEE